MLTGLEKCLASGTGSSPSVDKRLRERLLDILELEGFIRGKLAGKLECILATLDMRGLTPTEAQRKRILACTDIELAQQWACAAIIVSDVKSLLAMRGPKRRETQRRAA